MYNKRGESLVEVIVALGIFAFVFMGVVNIIAGSITLNTSSRQRTEVVSIVQKNLNTYLASSTNSGACSVVGRNIEIVSGYTNPAGCNTGALSESTQTCYWVEVKALSTSSPDETFPGSENFVKVVSTGRWYTRILGQQEFSVSRLIRNK